MSVLFSFFHSRNLGWYQVNETPFAEKLCNQGGNVPPAPVGSWSVAQTWDKPMAAVLLSAPHLCTGS